MKVLSSLFAATLLGLQLFSANLQAADLKEIKQQYAGLTVNAKLLMADGKTYKDPMVLLTHGTLTHNERSTYAQLQKT